MAIQPPSLPNILTPEASNIFAQLPAGDLRVVVQMAGLLNAANEQHDAAREQTEASLERLFRVVLESNRQLMTRVEQLTVDLDVLKQSSRENGALLEARLQESEARARAEKAASAAEAAQLREQNAALGRQVDAISGRCTHQLNALERRFASHTHSLTLCCIHSGYNCTMTPWTTGKPTASKE
jgi:hypothetical protein